MSVRQKLVAYEIAEDIAAQLERLSSIDVSENRFMQRNVDTLMKLTRKTIKSLRLKDYDLEPEKEEEMSAHFPADEATAEEAERQMRAESKTWIELADRYGADWRRARQ